MKRLIVNVVIVSCVFVLATGIGDDVDCDADDTDCGEIFEQQGLACNSKDSSILRSDDYSPTCCSDSASARIFENGTRAPARPDICLCCPSGDGYRAPAQGKNCPGSCVSPTQSLLTCNVEEENCAVILLENGVLCSGGGELAGTFTTACCSLRTSGAPAHRADDELTICVCCSSDGVPAPLRNNTREEDPCQGYCYDPLVGNVPQLYRF